MHFSESLSAPAQSAYSDLLGVVRDDELSARSSSLPDFQQENRPRRRVWYFQYTDVAAAKAAPALRRSG